jgi:hypothetical protein
MPQTPQSAGNATENEAGSGALPGYRQVSSNYKPFRHRICSLNSVTYRNSSKLCLLQTITVHDRLLCGIRKCAEMTVTKKMTTKKGALGVVRIRGAKLRFNIP